MTVWRICARSTYLCPSVNHISTPFASWIVQNFLDANGVYPEVRDFVAFLSCASLSVIVYYGSVSSLCKGGTFCAVGSTAKLVIFILACLPEIIELCLQSVHSIQSMSQLLIQSLNLVGLTLNWSWAEDWSAANCTVLCSTFESSCTSCWSRLMRLLLKSC